MFFLFGFANKINTTLDIQHDVSFFAIDRVTRGYNDSVLHSFFIQQHCTTHTTHLCFVIVYTSKSLLQVILVYSPLNYEDYSKTDRCHCVSFRFGF